MEYTMHNVGNWSYAPHGSPSRLKRAGCLASSGFRNSHAAAPHTPYKECGAHAAEETTALRLKIP